MPSDAVAVSTGAAIGSASTSARSSGRPAAATELDQQARLGRERREARANRARRLGGGLSPTGRERSRVLDREERVAISRRDHLLHVGILERGDVPDQARRARPRQRSELHLAQEGAAGSERALEGVGGAAARATSGA